MIDVEKIIERCKIDSWDDSLVDYMIHEHPEEVLEDGEESRD